VSAFCTGRCRKHAVDPDCPRHASRRRLVKVDPAATAAWIFVIAFVTLFWAGVGFLVGWIVG